jgi:hypothetical protein
VRLVDEDENALPLVDGRAGSIDLELSPRTPRDGTVLEPERAADVLERRDVRDVRELSSASRVDHEEREPERAACRSSVMERERRFPVVRTADVERDSAPIDSM